MRVSHAGRCSVLPAWRPCWQRKVPCATDGTHRKHAVSEARDSREGQGHSRGSSSYERFPETPALQHTVGSERAVSVCPVDCFQTHADGSMAPHPACDELPQASGDQNVIFVVWCPKRGVGGIAPIQAGGAEQSLSVLSVQDRRGSRTPRECGVHPGGGAGAVADSPGTEDAAVSTRVVMDGAGAHGEREADHRAARPARGGAATSQESQTGRTQRVYSDMGRCCPIRPRP